MLETRLPVSPIPSILPRPQTRPAAPAERRGAPPAAAGFARPERKADQAAARRPAPRPVMVPSRLARSEARMLALAVSVTALMCAVLVVYLAAYAHVTQLGLEKDLAKRQLAQVSRENQQLQVALTKLQDRQRIVAAAQKLHMVLYTGPAEYVSTDNGVTASATQASSAQFVIQGVTDASPAADNIADVRH